MKLPYLLKAIPLLVSICMMGIAAPFSLASEPWPPKDTSSHWKGNETHSTLDPSLFRGEFLGGQYSIEKAYRAAKEIPQILDHLYCYCHCEKTIGMKSLLSCYTNEHASHCYICLGEALMAYDLYKQGKSLQEIEKAVDKAFYSPYKS